MGVSISEALNCPALFMPTIASSSIFSATGASLTGRTVIKSVATLESPEASLAVNEIRSGPLKLGFGVYLKVPVDLLIKTIWPLRGCLLIVKVIGSPLGSLATSCEVIDVSSSTETNTGEATGAPWTAVTVILTFEGRDWPDSLSKTEKVNASSPLKSVVGV